MDLAQAKRRRLLYIPSAPTAVFSSSAATFSVPRAASGDRLIRTQLDEAMDSLRLRRTPGVAGRRRSHRKHQVIPATSGRAVVRLARRDLHAGLPDRLDGTPATNRGPART